MVIFSCSRPSAPAGLGAHVYIDGKFSPVPQSQQSASFLECRRTAGAIKKARYAAGQIGFCVAGDIERSRPLPFANRLKTRIPPKTVPCPPTATVLSSSYKGEGLPPFRQVSATHAL